MPTSTHAFNNEAHTATLTIEIPSEEYLKLVDKKLREYRKTVDLKGFRKGKAPLNLLRSRFGNSILFEEINQLIDTEVQQFIQNEKLRVLGPPIPKNTLDTSIQRPQDVKMDIEIVYVPAFEVQGIDVEQLLPYYEVEVSEEAFQEEVKQLRKQHSSGFEEGVTIVQDKDMLQVALRELENGEVKEDGMFEESTYITLDKVADELKDQLIGASVGDKIEASLYDLDNALTPEQAGRFFYDLEEVDVEQLNTATELEILEIKRLKIAELDEEFFKKVYPEDEFEDKEAFLARFKEDVANQYQPQINNIYYRHIYETLTEANKDMELPKEFLRDWLKESGEEDLSDERLDGFLGRLRWSLILDQLSEQRAIEVTQQDIEQRLRYALAQQYGFQIPPYHPLFDGHVEELMKDENTVRRYAEQILETKVLRSLDEDFGKDIKTVTPEELDEIYESIFNPSNEEESSETDESSSSEEGEALEEATASLEEEKED